MNEFISSRLGRRFLAMFLLLMLPVAAVAWWGMREASAALELEMHRVLRAASDGAEAQLREFLLSVKRSTQEVAEQDAIHKAIRGPDRATALTAAFKRLKQGAPEAQELFCLDAAGRVVAASGAELTGRDYSGSTLFKKGRESFCAGDVIRDENGAAHWRMSAPVKESGNTIGVVVIGIDPEALSSLTTGQRVLREGADTQSFRIGQTGETYLVNRDGFLITESRFRPRGLFKVKVDTQPVRVWHERGEEMIGDYKDYRGVPVSGASAIVNDPAWLLLTEIDFSQALAPMARLREGVLVWLVGVILTASLLAGAFARRIVRPVQALSEADQALAKGDEDGAIVCEEWLPANEIGQFVRKRNARIRELIQRQRDLAREQKARAEAAAELEKIMYSMVHDMRAPLRAIVSYGDLVRQGSGTINEAQRSYLERMRTAAAKMDQLICDMMRYGSLLQQEISLSPVKVSELVLRVIAEYPPFREHRDRIEVEPGIEPVMGNGAALEQCFAGVLDNALRYRRPGLEPNVKVRAEIRDDRVRIWIEDNGAGMPPEFQQRVFEIFQRGTSVPGGSGIGLALVRVAVERMGGRVGVESEEGKGSRFWIELKRAR